METISFHLQVFDGPLDLLLHLIAKNKVSIYDIPIFSIFEQYMAYLAEAEENRIELTADFAAMAAQLLYIKSKMLLPRHEEEAEEDPRARLVDMLLEYQRIKEAACEFGRRYEAGKELLVKQPEPIAPETDYLYQHAPGELLQALKRMKERSGRKMPPPVSAFAGIVGREHASVAKRIEHVFSRLREEGRISFWSLLCESRGRSEWVASFLAVLELMKSRAVEITQEENGDYAITLCSDEECIALAETAELNEF